MNDRSKRRSSSSPTAPVDRRGYPPALELDHVSLEFGRRNILKDASLRIAEGEFIGVLGPNGAGKTTLMRAMLGLLRRHPARSAFSAAGRARQSAHRLPAADAQRARRPARERPRLRRHLPPTAIAGACRC